VAIIMAAAINIRCVFFISIKNLRIRDLLKSIL